MKKFVLAAAAVIALGLPAVAQTPPDAASAPATAPAAGKTFSVDTSTIGDLLDNPAAKAVFQKYLPDVVANPQIDMGRAMHLGDIVQYVPDITPDKLAAIDVDLKALPPQ